MFKPQKCHSSFGSRRSSLFWVLLWVARSSTLYHHLLYLRLTPYFFEVIHPCNCRCRMLFWRIPWTICCFKLSNCSNLTWSLIVVKFGHPKPFACWSFVRCSFDLFDQSFTSVLVFLGCLDSWWILGCSLSLSNIACLECNLLSLN